MATEKRPVQHTPKHLEAGHSARHPAASSFAPLQPAAGVVADDVPPEQNPAGGPRASEAEGTIALPEPQVETVEVEVPTRRQSAKDK